MTQSKYQCFYCGHVEPEGCTKDHFIPRSKGGTLMVRACAICQFTKRGMMPMEFVEYMERHTAIKKSTKRRIRLAVELYLDEKTRL